MYEKFIKLIKNILESISDLILLNESRVCYDLDDDILRIHLKNENRFEIEMNLYRTDFLKIQNTYKFIKIEKISEISTITKPLLIFFEGVKMSNIIYETMIPLLSNDEILTELEQLYIILLEYKLEKC